MDDQKVDCQKRTVKVNGLIPNPFHCLGQGWSDQLGPMIERGRWTKRTGDEDDGFFGNFELFKNDVLIHVMKRDLGLVKLFG